MKRLAILALLSAAACQSKPAEPKVLILQCDGVDVTSFRRGEIMTDQRRTTFRIDSTENSISYWDAEARQWVNPVEGIEVTNTQIKHQRQKADDEGGSTNLTIFDRTLGTVSEKTTIFGPGLYVQSEFNGKCVTLDKPSEDRAF